MEKRESFNSKWGFILACIGSAVGMGNLWMFPTRVSLYGGGSFLIPYFIFVALIGSTGVIGEMCLGRGTRSGPIDAFGAACETRGRRKLGDALGFIPAAGSLAMAIGYTVVMGWILKYAIGAFTGATLAPADTDGFASAFGSMASAFGNNGWQLAALFFCILILMFGVGSGIENANKLMMPVFFILFVFLGIYVAFQPGAMQGYRYIFRIDPEILADPKTWIFALGQAFFSLSVAGNGTLIYGSYLSDEENIPASAARVALFDTIAAILAALVIIPAMATTGAKLDQGGPGLLFIYLPEPHPLNAGRYVDRDHFLRSRSLRRDDLPAQPLRSTDRHRPGKTPPWPRPCLRGYRYHRSCRLPVNPGHRLRLDGRALHLHLPARCRTRRNHVLLGIRKRLCRNAGQQRPRKEIFKMVCTGVPLYLYSGMCAGINIRHRIGRYWMILDDIKK